MGCPWSLFLVDDVPGALERLLEEGVTEVAVQPTHVMHGFEYDKLQSQAAAFTGRFPRLYPSTAPTNRFRTPAART